MEEAKKQLAEWDKELDQLHTRNGDLGLEVQNLTEQLAKERDDRKEIEAQLSDLRKNSAAASRDLPEAAELFNQLKAKRKKPKTDIPELEVILEILES